MSKYIVPPGHVLLRVDDLAELLGRQAPPPAAAEPTTPTMASLGEAIALISAKQQGIPNVGLSGDIPAGAVTAALTSLATAFLGALLPEDRAAALLTDLGIVAVRDTKP